MINRFSIQNLIQVKKIDKLLVLSFIPPFIMTFFIALFVLIMQFLWKYIDDIVGKGLEIILIFELIFYLSMSLVPLALPIAVLISSVMVMGNLAERYELASMKSAGIPLLRIMGPLVILASIITITSFFIANNLIPYSNLKFQSRLYDIRKQKPGLSLEEGIFNDDFKGFSIRVGKKGASNQELEDVLIYDHTHNKGSSHQIIATKGEMYAAENDRYMVMRLYDGTQYQDVKNSSKRNKNYPFVRVRFKEWRKVFDMGEFELNRTDEDLFKNHHRMLNSRALLQKIDTINLRRQAHRDGTLRKSVPYFYFQKIRDSLLVRDTMKQRFFKDTTITDFLHLIPATERLAAITKAISMAKRIKEYSTVTAKNLKRTHRLKVDHYNELHRKMTFAVACFIFLFIGAPMGAIVRKGGFGWPLLIAIVFFVTFVVISLIGERLSQQLVLSPFFGMWLPCLILFPFGIFLTYKAMNDSKILDLDTYVAALKKFIGFLGIYKAFPFLKEKTEEED